MFWFQHENYYKLLPQYIKEKSIIPCFGEVSLNKLFEGYKDQVLDSYINNYRDTSIYSHPAIIAAWAGEELKAKEYLEWGYSIMQNRYSKESLLLFTQKREENFKENIAAGRKVYIMTPKRKRLCSTIDEYLKYMMGDINGELIVKEWYDKHKAMIDNPEALRQKVRDRIKENNFTYAPYRDLVGVNYQENNLLNPKLK
jgi:hypothetical protein